MFRLGVIALLILSAIVIGTASISKDICDPTHYCQDGYKCCTDNLHCCPLGTYCCYQNTRCCYTAVESSQNAMELTGFNASNETGAFDQEDVAEEPDYQQLQETLQRISPRFHRAREQANLNRPIGENPVLIIYN